MSTNPPSRRFIDTVRARTNRDHEFRQALQSEIDDAERNGQHDLANRLRTVLTTSDPPHP